MSTTCPDCGHRDSQSHSCAPSRAKQHAQIGGGGGGGDGEEEEEEENASKFGDPRVRWEEKRGEQIPSVSFLLSLLLFLLLSVAPKSLQPI